MSAILNCYSKKGLVYSTKFPIMNNMSKVMSSSTGLVIQPNPRFSPDGKLSVAADTGYLRIDNVRFIYEK
jgi:hypothetical protein